MTDTPLTLRVAIVDDEELARRVLREYLDDVPNVEIVAECGNGFEAVKAVVERRPDVLILDVQMPKLDGFEVLELVGKDVAVIFSTAYDAYALRAFDVHAVDYIVKPYSPERLNEALTRARERIARRERVSIPREAIAAAQPDRGFPSRVLVRDGARVHIVPVATIDFVQAQDDYVCFHAEGKEYLKDETLGDVEASLDPARFVRIHRSYLLNIDRLARVELDERENRVAVLKNGKKLPVSRTGYQRLSDTIK